MAYAVRFEDVTKRYPRGWSEGEEPRYASLRHDLASIGKRIGARVRGRHAVETGTLALDDVSFEVEEGESFAIIGANGAGKSTALKLISRISYPTSGRVRVRGRVAALMEVSSGVHPELTGRENIWLYGQILGMSRSDIRRRFDEIVDLSDLSRALDTPVKFFSSGMQLRLGFSIAVHLEPDIFVVDEALAVGDAAFQLKCMQRMGALVESGRTLLFVSHSLPIVRQICTRGLLLSRGAVDFVGEADRAVDRYLQHVSRGQLPITESDAVKVKTFRVVEAAHGAALPATGDRVVIEVQLELEERVEDAVVGFGISDGRAGNLVNASMLSDQRSAPLGEGSACVRCIFASLPLMPGQYEVWFSIHSHFRGTYYFRPRIVGTLVIRDAPNGRTHDSFFATTGGFGPVHVDYDIAVM